MSEKDNQEPELIDYDLLSDEEFNALPFPDDLPVEEEAHDDTTKEADDEGETEEEIEDEADEDTSGDEDLQPDSGSEEAGTTDTEESEEDAEVDEESTELDALAELLKTPIKVGDQEITINSGEELVTLARRGIGANKRMQELAPKLKILRSLEANGLLDENKLNFLTALDKKDPEAIKQLIAESGIDSFDASTSNVDENYKPKDYSVSDAENAIQEVFDDIKDTASFQDTVKTLQGLDPSSKADVQSDPSVINLLNVHHADGSYKQIQAIIAKERLLGNIDRSVSDIAAYKHVWNVIQENPASTDGGQEAGHEGTTNDQLNRENLANTSDGSNAGHKTKGDTQVSKATTKAAKAAKVTNKNRGSQQAETIDFDKLTDDQIREMEVSELFS